MAQNPVLLVHYGLGFLVFLGSLAAIFVPVWRRVTLYALVLQIVLGAILWFGVGLPAPRPLHWILALVVGGVYAGASAAQRRGRSALPYTIAAAVLVALVFGIGMHQVRHG